VPVIFVNGSLAWRAGNAHISITCISKKKLKNINVNIPNIKKN
jgi:hypothetical protein